MAYNVKNQDDFNNLSPQDKITYLSQNQNSDIYKNELNRVTGILGQNPNNTGALDWYSRVQAANAGVDANSINNNTYDPSKYQYQNPANGVGIRDTMVSMGMDNNKIGWRGEPGGLGTVTYDGKDFMQANSLNNGTSYAANVNDIYGAAVDYWKGTPNQIVDVTDYLANSQLPFNANYQNGKVMINGIAVDPAFVIDGNAYMNQSQLDQIMNQAMQQSGLQNNYDIWKKYDDKYTPTIDALLDKIVNREEFNYDPEQDIVYQAYRDQYNREGDKALRDTMGSMAGLTGGFINSAAVTAGAQAEQQWKDALMDRIPELAQQAYGRYVDDYNMNRSALSDVQNQYTQAFNREYGVNRDTMDDIRYNNALNTERDDQAYERNWNERVYNDEQAWRQKEWDEYNNRYWYEANRADNQWYADEVYRWAGFNRDNIMYDQKRIENALSNAQQRGKFTEEEAALLNVPLDADPRYYDKTTLQIQNNAEKELLAYQYALQDQYDEKAAARNARYSTSRSNASSRSRSSSSNGDGNDGYIDSESSGISAEAQQLHDEIDARLRAEYGLGINQVSAETQAAYVMSSNYPDEVKDDLLNAMAIPDSVIDQVIKDYQRRA